MSTSDRRSVLRCGVGLLVIAFAVALGSNVALGLVLERFGAAGLPTLTMVHAGLLAATTIIVARYARGSIVRWLVGSLVLAALLVGASAVVFEVSAAAWSVSLLYLVTSVLGDVVLSLFWVMVAELFDMRAAKRAAPRIAAAGTVGAALAGFLAPAVTRVAGVRGLLVALVVALAASAIWSFSYARRSPVPSAAPEVRSSRSGGAAGATAAEDTDLMRAIVVGAVVVSAVTLFGRYLYARALEASYPGDAAAIASQNGLLMGIGSVLTTVTQLVVTPAAMGRVGVRATMAVYPLAMVAVFGALAARFGLVTGVCAHFATSVLRKGIQAPAESVLPLALSSERTARTSLLAGAVGAPAGMMLAGAVLRFGRAWSAEALALIGLGVAASLVAVTSWRARRYGDALRLRLRKGGSELRLRLAGALGEVRDLRSALDQDLDPADPALLARLETLVRVLREREGAGGATSIDVQALARVIEARLGEAWRLRAALDRLAHPAPPGLDDLWRRAIRQRLESDISIVLLALRASTGHADLDRVAPRLFDADPRARGAAVELLEALCPADLRPVFVPLIEGVGLEDGRSAAVSRFGPPGDDPILDLLDVPDDWLRAITVYAIATNGDRYRDRVSALRTAGDPWLTLARDRVLEGNAHQRTSS